MNGNKDTKRDENAKCIYPQDKLYGITSMKSNLFRTYNLKTPL